MRVQTDKLLYMRRKRYNRVQGLLFSDVQMEQMLRTPPALPSHAPSVRVATPLSDRDILQIAVRDCLESAGENDPYLFEDFIGWLGMQPVDSG